MVALKDFRNIDTHEEYIYADMQKVEVISCSKNFYFLFLKEKKKGFSPDFSLHFKLSEENREHQIISIFGGDNNKKGRMITDIRYRERT